MISKILTFFFPKPKTELERIIDRLNDAKSLKSISGSINQDHFFTLDNLSVTFSFKGDKVVIKNNGDIMFASDNPEEVKTIFETLVAVSERLNYA